MATIINQQGITEEQWLENRRKGLGGSDAGAVLGFNKYTSPYKLFLEKTGVYKEEFDSEAAYFGHVLEDVVRKEFEKRTGKKVITNDNLYVHDEYSFMQANLDGEIEGENAGFEAKTASEYLKDEWVGDEIPASYLCQLHHYMAVMNYDRMYIAYLIGGNKFGWKVVNKDPEFEKILIEREKWFWEECVLKNEPPEVDGSDATSSLFNSMYPEDDGTEIMLGKDLETVIDALEQVKKDIKELDVLKKKYENEIKKVMEKAKKGHTQKHLVVYSSYETNRIDSKKLKEEKPELFEEYSKKSVTRKMTIKKLEETKNGNN